MPARSAFKPEPGAAVFFAYLCEACGRRGRAPVEDITVHSVPESGRSWFEVRCGVCDTLNGCHVVDATATLMTVSGCYTITADA